MGKAPAHAWAARGGKERWWTDHGKSLVCLMLLWPLAKAGKPLLYLYVHISNSTVEGGMPFVWGQCLCCFMFEEIHSKGKRQTMDIVKQGPIAFYHWSHWWRCSLLFYWINQWKEQGELGAVGGCEARADRALSSLVAAAAGKVGGGSLSSLGTLLSIARHHYFQLCCANLPPYIWLLKHNLGVGQSNKLINVLVVIKNGKNKSYT